MTTSNGFHFTGQPQGMCSLLIWEQGIEFLHYFFAVLRALFCWSLVVEMITVTHVSIFKKTFWSSYWFISHSIGICRVTVRQYISGRKMKGGRIEALGYLCLVF